MQEPALNTTDNSVVSADFAEAAEYFAVNPVPAIDTKADPIAYQVYLEAGSRAQKLKKSSKGMSRSFYNLSPTTALLEAGAEAQLLRSEKLIHRGRRVVRQVGNQAGEPFILKVFSLHDGDIFTIAKITREIGVLRKLGRLVAVITSPYSLNAIQSKAKKIAGYILAKSSEANEVSDHDFPTIYRFAHDRKIRIFKKYIPGFDLWHLSNYTDAMPWSMVMQRLNVLGEYSELDFAIDLIKLVQSFHDLNLLHCDIKPENIIFDPVTLDLELVDFDTTFDCSLTGTKLEAHSHDKLGTAEYMAPELWVNGIKHYTAKSDIYALGQVLKELCKHPKILEIADRMMVPDPKTRVDLDFAHRYLSLFATMENSKISSEPKPQPAPFAAEPTLTPSFEIRRRANSCDVVVDSSTARAIQKSKTSI